MFGNSKLIIITASLTLATIAGAEPEQPEEAIVIHGDPEKVLVGDFPLFGQALVIDEIDPTASKDVADVLAAAGGELRKLGGVGSFATVSFRGGDPSQTAILVDGIPLSKLSAVVLDANAFSLGSFSQINVYRGGAPGLAMSDGMTGTVDMRTFGASENNYQMSYSVGSFGTHDLRASAEVTGRWQYRVAGSYFHTDGNFAFYDNRRTVLNPGDDQETVRSNNQLTRGSFVARVRRRAKHWWFESGARVVSKQQGVPGQGVQQTLDVDLSSQGVLADAVLGMRFKEAAISGQFFSLLEDQQLSNPSDELPLSGAISRTGTQSFGGSLRARKRFGKPLELIGSATARRDGLSQQGIVQGEGSRVELGVSLALPLTVNRLTVTPGMGLSHVRTVAPIPETAGGGEASVRASPITPRLGIEMLIVDELSIKGNVGRYYRLPTVLEYFGDRGFVRGNPFLEPEVGWTSDIGLVTQYRSDSVELTGQVAAFRAITNDKIAFVAADAFSSSAQNIGVSSSQGGELMLQATLWRRITLSSRYTYSDALFGDNPDDQMSVPYRPRHLFWNQLSAAIGGTAKTPLVVLGTEADYRSDSYLDKANLNRNPGRVLWHATGVVNLSRDYSLGLSVRNLTDRRIVTLPVTANSEMTAPHAISDFYGYPIPGRSVFFNLTMRYPHPNQDNKQ